MYAGALDAEKGNEKHQTRDQKTGAQVLTRHQVGRHPAENCHDPDNLLGRSRKTPIFVDQIDRKKQNQRGFHKLGGLKTHAADLNPARRTVCPSSDRHGRDDQNESGTVRGTPAETQ